MAIRDDTQTVCLITSFPIRREIPRDLDFDPLHSRLLRFAEGLRLAHPEPRLRLLDSFDRRLLIVLHAAYPLLRNR